MSHGDSSIIDDIKEKYAVQERIVDYWWDVDKNNAVNAADFYTDDCVYQMLDHRWEGHEPILAYYRFRNSRGPRLVRHLLSNVRVHIHSSESATLIGALSVYAVDGVPIMPAASPIMIADEECGFVKGQDGKWRMRTHGITALFKGGSGVELLEPPTT